MVGLNGLEPSTSRLSGVRSNQLSYRPTLAGAVGIEPTLEVLETSVLPLNYAPINGGGGRIRTAEPIGSGFTVRRV
jgi:hypothetical protein